MPRPLRAAAVQNSAPLHSPAEVTEWIPGSSRRRFAAAPPRDDERWTGQERLKAKRIEPRSWDEVFDLPSLTTSGWNISGAVRLLPEEVQGNTAMVISQEERVAHIRKRAHELWEREGLMPDREKACWDKAVEEFESGKLTAGRKQAGADAAGDTAGAKH